MKIDFVQYLVQYNFERCWFEVKSEGKIVVVEYIMMSQKLILIYIEVFWGLEGNGIGSYLVVVVLIYVKDNDLVVMFLCFYMVGYIVCYLEWKFILVFGINVSE